MPEHIPALGRPGARAARHRGLPPPGSRPVHASSSPRRGHQLAGTRKQLGLDQKQIAAPWASAPPAYPRSSTARSPPSRSSPAMSRPSAGWTSWPTPATGPSGCPSATPRPPHDNHQATASPARRPTRQLQRRAQSCQSPGCPFFAGRQAGAPTRVRRPWNWRVCMMKCAGSPTARPNGRVSSAGRVLPRLRATRRVWPPSAGRRLKLHTPSA